MRTLSQDQARRILLSRQGLIEPFSEPLDAVCAMIAVQTQYAASLPVAVAARVRKGRPGWEDAALDVGGTLVKAWSVRNTLHTHLPEDHSLILGTLGARSHSRYVGWMNRHRSVDVHALEARIEDALAEGPLTREELHARVPSLKEISGTGWGLDVMGLAFRRRLCVVGRGSRQSFALLDVPPATADLGGLLRRYLGSFGPATFVDFAHWVGRPQQELRSAIEAAGELERVQIEGLKGERLMVPGMADEIPTSPLGVRLLAKFDPLILAHKDKRLLIDEAHRPHVFRKAAQVEAPVLSEGKVVATWRLERKGSRATFVLDPIRPLGKRETQRLEREATGLAKRLGLTFAGWRIL